MAEIIALDHVQLAMPAGQESEARAFYGSVLGLVEEPKPANLAKRGGVWFRGGTLRLHLGVDADCRAARKAHPAFLVHGLAGLAERCRAAGYPPTTDEPLDGALAALAVGVVSGPDERFAWDGTGDWPLSSRRDHRLAPLPIGRSSCLREALPSAVIRTGF